MTPQQLVIVGGGTAGWMAANLLAHYLRDEPVRIMLVEAPDVPTVGVGEGSTPTLRRFFAELDIAEHEWMPQCQATYKVGIQFNQWSPQRGPASYRHPFISQLDTFSERPFTVNCQTRRLGLDVTTHPEAFLFNGYLAANKCAPVTPDNFPFRIEYGYHFDAAKLGEFLKHKAMARQVEYCQVHIEEVAQHPSGAIKALHTRDGQMINGDLFIDCSGFRSLLAQQTLKVPFRSYQQNLFNDRAVVLPGTADASRPVETQATALSAGWTWSIPLRNRTGNGYVFSSAHLSDDVAETELRRHLGLLDDPTPARFLPMKVGRVEQHWTHNCLALGLAQGFIEPLEATALHLVQLSIRHFAKAYQKGRLSAQYQAECNTQINALFDNVRDYIVAHYVLNTRSDSQYWQDNRNTRALPESLLKILDVWYRRGDLAAQLQQQPEESQFPAASWHCLLAGYGVFPELATNQPGSGDLFKEHELARFFAGCLLNFKPQASLF